MKPYHLLGLCVLLIFGIIACESSTVEVKKEETMDKPKVQVDTISEATFKEWTSAWDKHQRSWLDTSKITYFSLPIIDLKEVLSEKALGSKFYLGLDSIGENHFEGKLMLVGTDDKGNLLVDAQKGFNIYDFSKLCPPFCIPPED